MAFDVERTFDVSHHRPALLQSVALRERYSRKEIFFPWAITPQTTSMPQVYEAEETYFDSRGILSDIAASL